MRTRTILSLPLLLLLLALGACSPGHEGATLEAGRATTATPPTPGHPETDGSATEPPSGSTALIATATAAELPAFSEPDETAGVVASFGQTTGFGSPTTFLVVDGEGQWLEVLLPIRPNGTTGWVRASDVSVSETGLQVLVDLEQRQLTVLEDDEVLLESAVAVGAPDAPTPTGLHYVTDLLVNATPDGAYGPYAFGLSAHSETYSEFGGGDGQIGMHGTDDPSSIGQAVSHGCIRLPNEVVSELSSLLPLGTPVQIV